MYVLHSELQLLPSSRVKVPKSRLNMSCRCWPWGLCNMTPLSVGVYVYRQTVHAYGSHGLLRHRCYAVCMILFYLLWNHRTESRTKFPYRGIKVYLILSRSNICNNLVGVSLELKLADSWPSAVHRLSACAPKQYLALCIIYMWHQQTMQSSTLYVSHSKCVLQIQLDRGGFILG